MGGVLLPVVCRLRARWIASEVLSRNQRRRDFVECASVMGDEGCRFKIVFCDWLKWVTVPRGNLELWGEPLQYYISESKLSIWQ